MRFGDHRPVFGQLVDMLSMEVLDGTLKPGSELPDAETIAMATGTNPLTVKRALDELSQFGAIEEDGKGGHVVVGQAVSILRELARERFIKEEMPALAKRLRLFGIEPEELDWKAAIRSRKEK